MGSNKRYPGLSEQLAEERELRTARTRGPLQTLTDDQLRLHTVPLTVVPEHTAITGRAWLRFGDADVRATVRLLRWTVAAAGVEFTIDGDVMRCWVWRGAVALTT